MARNVPTELILLEIAAGLSNLAKNPNLDESIKAAHALTEAEKVKADEARAYIDSSAEIKADLDKQREELSIIDDRLAEVKKIEAFNEDTLRSIAKSNAELKAREEAVAKVEADNILREKVQKEKDALQKLEENHLQGISADLVEYEARLNKAAQISQDALKDI